MLSVNNQKPKSSGWHSCFSFVGSRVQISSRRSGLLTDLFVAFGTPSRQVPRRYLKLGQNNDLPHSFQLMPNLPSYHSTLCLMCSMSVHYIIQKPLITNKMHKEFFSDLQHTLTCFDPAGSSSGRTFCCGYTTVALYS
jgi:hypothetical protein